ncbi:[protein-PII] uridylyltransferase [Amnimonas aquatica]|uniref:Bifunctional uridylyltransferase/uridylyl-removing enzyme n=1 Tax=Amnimonas aquatica TaxID=2094561 RepID=A0A2P6AVJ7_9GAMM|nr:[protein-PII] uridylyltransferase [Amnimonas aquatica]PQA52359.1 [protein-PII] uridylyltransferase [Amnimonas aquatica]
MDDTSAPAASLSASADKATLKAVQAQLMERFGQGRDVRLLVREWADAVDDVLRQAWATLGLGEAEELALIAVGGYGRAELHPQSDVDVLVLHRQPQLDEILQAGVSAFITHLWDLGLDVGSSVRSLDDCVRLAREDITIATNLMESRTLVGSDALRREMQRITGPEHLWPGKAFFIAKRDEQVARHAKHNNTEYNLEPDLKNAPGGLRDIQTIGWVAKRHFGADTLRGLIAHGFLTEAEFEELDACQCVLWRIRFALNQVSGRNETRILFDYQRRIAELFGYSDSAGNRGVEQLMQDYYRAAMRISMLNEMLLQYFDEAILRADEPVQIVPLNSRFQLRNGAMDVTRDDVFKRTPSALLEIFVLLGDLPDVYNVRASTIRLIMQHAHLIDDRFRGDIRNKSLFMELLRCRTALFASLRRMKRYGVLGRYIPAFGAIIGKMQYDLFHIYTVDAHTLLVLKNMRRFRYEGVEERFPVVAEVARKLPKIELLYLAGLFHDIAKGRGGDHSELGAVDAREFCLAHGLGRWDASLVAWLTLNHLIMSVTAQKKDVSDPDVINEFAQKVGDVVHLDYLYALTVADICATNPNLWNSWRASLLRQLYTQTKRALRRGLVNPIAKQEWIAETRASSLELLESRGVHQADAERIWDRLGDDYFLRESAKDIAWHTAAILRHPAGSGPLVLVRENHSEQYEGATQLFVYTHDMPNLFAATVAALDQLQLTVMDARIITSNDGYSLDSYIVLDENGERIVDRQRIAYLGEELSQALANPDRFPDIVQRRLPRQLKHFDVRTDVRLSNDLTSQRTILEITTLDRPGLLARIGRIFMAHGVNVQNARIATLGERAEDIFFLTNSQQQPFSDPIKCEALCEDLRTQLDEKFTIKWA